MLLKRETPQESQQTKGNQKMPIQVAEKLFPGEAKPPVPSCSTHMECSDKEYACLTQYICRYWDEAHTDKWPMMKNTKFWNFCADFVSKVCNWTG